MGACRQWWPTCHQQSKGWAGSGPCLSCAAVEHSTSLVLKASSEGAGGSCPLAVRRQARPGCGPCLSCAAVLLLVRLFCCGAALLLPASTSCRQSTVPVCRSVQHQCRQIKACHLWEAAMLDTSALTAIKSLWHNLYSFDTAGCKQTETFLQIPICVLQRAAHLLDFWLAHDQQHRGRQPPAAGYACCPHLLLFHQAMSDVGMQA